MIIMNEPQYEIVSFFPENFFNKDVNEPFTKKIMNSVLDVKEWRKGDPNHFEPDYFGDDIPFEFTLASDSKKKNNFIQKMIKGKFYSEDLEQEVFSYIMERINDKAERNYSVENVHLCVLCLLNMFNWVSDEYGSVSHWMIDIPRQNFFDEIKNTYIETKIFNNIFIIFPDMCGKWWVFDVLTNYKKAVSLTVEEIKSRRFPFVFEKQIYEEYMKY